MPFRCHGGLEVAAEHGWSYRYGRFKIIQGSHVPYCYAVYKFDLPGGFNVKGMVLEDLTRSMRTVDDEHQLIEPKKSGEIFY